MKKIISIGFPLFFWLIFFAILRPDANALNMESNRYKIQFGDVNIGAGNTESDNYQLSTSLGQNAAAEFHSKGYIVKAGFQYVQTIIPFTFSISDTKIDFGPLQPNIAKIKETDLTVSFGGAGAYQVTAAKEGPLKTENEAIIPDTTCDTPDKPCTDTGAKPWTRSDRYGFGFGIYGDDIPVDFVSRRYFRSFADTEIDENPAVIMSSDNVTEDYSRNPKHTRQARATFKVIVSESQQPGTYRTTINFVATPSF